MLDIGDFAPDHVTQFVVDRQSGEILSHEEAGSAYPVSERYIKSHNIAFPLTLAPNALVDVYLRVQSKTRIQLAPRLYSSLAFQQQEHAFYTGAYLCYGGLIALVLYHLIFSLYSRESESAYFIFFMVTWGAYSALLEGLLQPLIPDQLIIYFRSDYQAAAAIFPVIALAAFTAKYLRQLKTYAYFRWILAGVCIITAITSTVTIAGWFPFPQMRNIIILMVVAAICIHTLIFSVLVINGHGPARFYLAGALLMLFFILNVAWIYIAYTGLYTDVGIWLRLSYMSPLLFFAAGYGQRINELRTQHNESLKSAALAKEKMEFKTRFFAKMTHEIRSPMNGIIGPVELLRLTTLTKEQEKYIDIIETSGNALLHISNDILDFSKLEAGKLALSVSTFSLRDLVAECASIFSVHPKRNAILFDTDIAADLPDYFEGDEYRLRRVLFNLIGNAFKFTDKGSIKLNVRRGDDALTNDIIEFSVIDSGIGIDAERFNSIIFRVSAGWCCSGWRGWHRLRSCHLQTINRVDGRGDCGV